MKVGRQVLPLMAAALLAGSALVAIAATDTPQASKALAGAIEQGKKPSDEWMKRGADLYAQNCAACHQQNGQGLPGAFPPLANSDFIAKDPSAIVDITVNGRQGKMVVNGVEYNNIMPAMSFLSDKDLAAIITFVLNSWGNPGGTVQMSKVTAFRKAQGAEARQAAGQRHPGAGEAEQSYQSQPSQVVDARVRMTPGAPPVSEEEFRCGRSF